MMNVVQMPCRRSNYGSVRKEQVRYLVIHYTASPNDTAKGNGAYFAREHTGTSAHYFVDENMVVCSVPEQFVAWHCGANHYRHPHCRNGNSIGIEICTKADGRGYFFDPCAVERAKELVRELMQRYGIGPEQVLRHYDVTGKCCPAPFVEQGAWEEFQGGLLMYRNLEEVPAWGRPTIEKLVERGLLRGDGEQLELSRDLVRIMVILDRAGILEKEEEHGK